MRYVIINGSPRKKNTWAVVEQVKTNLNGEFDEIHLAKEKIPMCVGCYNCILKGEKYCPHFDKVNPIVERIKKADAIIMTSPVYAMNVTALLKNFLDHTAYLFHRPVCFTKKAMVIVTTAGAGHKKSAVPRDPHPCRVDLSVAFHRALHVLPALCERRRIEDNDVIPFIPRCHLREEFQQVCLHEPQTCAFLIPHPPVRGIFGK